MLLKADIINLLRTPKRSKITSRAAFFSLTINIFLFAANALAIMLITTSDFPVPGGPNINKFLVKLLTIASFCDKLSELLISNKLSFSYIKPLRLLEKIVSTVGNEYSSFKILS